MPGRKATVAAATMAAIVTFGAGGCATCGSSKEHEANVAAERIQACEMQHGLKAASAKTEFTEKTREPGDDHDTSVRHLDFLSCSWPVPPYADADGYLAIYVRIVDGPGEGEASRVDYADRITAPCPRIQVEYQHGNVDQYAHEHPFLVDADTVVSAYDGKLYDEDDFFGGNNRELAVSFGGSLPFYPDKGDFVVVHNGKMEVSTAKCL